MTKEPISTEELQSLLTQDKQIRLQTCKNEIDAILQKQGCQLIALPQFTPDGRTVAIISVQIKV